jgi:hypothetical protein
MPKTLIIKELTYHAVYFQKSPALFQIALEIWEDKLWCEPFEITEVISIQ